jgi:hypothetical protein
MLITGNVKVKFLLITLIVVISCQTDGEEEIQNIVSQNSTGTNNLTIKDWSDATHGNKVSPDYEVVFPQNKVNTMEITMTSEDWKKIQSNMVSLYGFAFGAGGTQPGATFPNAEPDYVSVSMKFNGREWYKVGFRLKGNSTLRNSWRNGIYKLPFRLNMDYFENTYPQIKNQRFYGFEELSMSPGANDNSLIREKAGSDIFRAAGIPCSQTAFYKVFINFGDGLKYCGVYTMVEVVDDTMIQKQFGEKIGNIYKPESRFQAFVQSQFEKKNNETANDYTDVQAVINTLNSTLRTSNPEAWRAELEKNFNADHFMKWLAINTTMLNWDTYGRMAHNYYLYNLTGKGLTWIPWDNNEAMLNRGNNNYTISLSTTDATWPLIRYLMDDPVYNAKYKVYMKEFVQMDFTQQKINELLTRYHTLISPYVIGPEMVETGKYTHLTGPAAFTSALDALKQHVVSQQSAATAYLQ